MADLTFFFDPVCPWTWRASRWLTTVAETRGLAVAWRPFSLLVLNDGPDDEHGAALETSHRALRLVEHLHATGRDEDVAALYAALGQLAHEERFTFDDELVAQAVRAAGFSSDGAALDDDSFDAGVRASTETAVAAAGPGVGSPVMIRAGAPRGLHGPVLKSVPDKPEALALWDSVEPLFHLDDFFEIKRGRA
jgi:2-hydroxychromene-2-carboxylate isomerase